MASFTGRPVVGADDGYIQVLDTVFNNNADFTAFGQTGGYVSSAWIRVPNANIPKGVTILTAKITCKAYQNDAGTTILSNIYMNDSDNAVAPTNYAGYGALATTTAFSAWDSEGAWVENTLYDSPDFAPAVQEVVNRPGWVKGNALMVLIKDDGSDNNAIRLPDSQDLAETTAVLITITYTEIGKGKPIWW